MCVYLPVLYEQVKVHMSCVYVVQIPEDHLDPLEIV